VEILIVVVILGILAAIAVPKFSNASQISRENTLKEDLRLLRTQIGVYHAQHADIFPGYPGGNTYQTPTGDVFVAQLTTVTDSVGNTNAGVGGAFQWGPYLNAMPANPVNALATLKILGPGDAMTPDGSTGWLYQPSTGAIEPNLAGQDSEGQNFAGY
jgi:general secretion pathway protein G